MEAWRGNRQDALVKELTRLATTNEGNGEMAFAITTLIVGAEGLAGDCDAASGSTIHRSCNAG